MIILFIGGMGSGKTLSMTRHLYGDHLKGKAIYTNYGLNFGKPTMLTAQFFKDYQKFDVRDASIAIDEMHVFMDSRGHMNKRNKALSKFITQSRKRSVTLYATTQHFRQVDVRLRNLVDMIVECKRVKGQEHIIVNYHYKWGRNDFVMFRTTTFKASPYYKLYDTNQIIDINEDL